MANEGSGSGPRFDDSFDPLALSISRQEKRNMIKGLGAAVEGIEQGQAAQTDKDTDKKIRKKPQQQLKTGFWEKVVRFFVMLFTGVRGEEYLRRKKMKALKRDLKRIRPPVYNFRKNTVMAGVASQLFVLFEYLMPYRTAFNSIFSNEQSQPPLKFQLLFLKSCCNSRSLDKISIFEEENLGGIVANHDEPLVREKVRQALKKYLASFSDEDRKRINHTFVEMLHIYDLLEFDFIAFLEKFNRDFSLHQSQRPVFNDARPTGLVFLLKKLQTVLLMVNSAFIPDVFEAARQFFNSQDVVEGDTEKGTLLSIMERMSQNGYRSIISGMSKIIQDGRLQLLIRYIDKDFQWAPTLRKRNRDFFRDFARTLAENINKSLDRLFKQKADTSLGKKLFSLLGMKELPSLYIYSEEKNQLLAPAKLPVFQHPKALNLAVPFLSNVYSPKLRPFLNRVIAEGHFPDNELMRTISEDVHTMDAHIQDINSFAAMVTPETDKGMVLEKMISKFKGDGPSKNAITMHINDLNKKLTAILGKLQITINSIAQLIARPDVQKSMAHVGDARMKDRFNAVNEALRVFSGLLRSLFRPAG